MNKTKIMQRAYNLGFAMYHFTFLKDPHEVTVRMKAYKGVLEKYPRYTYEIKKSAVFGIARSKALLDGDLLIAEAAARAFLKYKGETK